MRKIFTIAILLLVFSSCSNAPDVFDGTVVEKHINSAHTSTSIFCNGETTLISPMYIPASYSVSVGNDTACFTYTIKAEVFYKIEIGDTVTAYKNGNITTKQTKRNNPL